MVEISKEIVEIVNKPGRIGTLGTSDKQGQPNVGYFGSPRLMEDGTIIMGLGSNRTLKNLEENPLAVFFCVSEGPVTFKTPGCRLYLKVREIQTTAWPYRLIHCRIPDRTCVSNDGSSPES